MQTKAHEARAELEKWKPNWTEPNRSRTNRNEPKMDKCVFVVASGKGAGNCKPFDGCVEGEWLMVWGHCRGWGQHNKANELLRNTQVPGDCLTRCLRCFAAFSYHSFYTSFCFPSFAIISLFLVVAVVVLFVSLEVQMLSSFAFVVVAVSPLSLSQSLLCVSVSLVSVLLSDSCLFF